MNRCHICTNVAVHSDAALCLTCSAAADRGEIAYDPQRGWLREEKAAAPMGDPVVEQALILAADIVAGMKRAAAHGSIVGHHAEAYGAAEVEIRRLAKKVKSGEEFLDHNGLVRRFGGHVSAPTAGVLVPKEPTPEMMDAGVMQCRLDIERGYGPRASKMYSAMLAAAPEVVLPTDCDVDVSALREDFGRAL